jgi:long-chain acyl-CoA synthetase
MVLTGGLNVSSKEVEGAIAAHPAVHDAAVVGTADRTFGEAVVAFVEVRIGMTVTVEEIVEHCRSRIASYKKPKYVFFETLPRNAQGKVLKRALRARVAELLPS